MAISLPTVVEDYLDSLITALTVGSDLGSSMNAAAQNYLRASDMATALDLLQEELGSITHVASAGGTTTTVVDTAIYVANEQVGNIVVFGAATTTTALQGVEVRILANSTTVLTTEPTSEANVIGDVYSIKGGVADVAIAALRQGTGRGDSPRGSVYGSHLQAISGMTEIIRATGYTSATLTALQARVSDQIVVHPGAQPGENAVLAAWIQVTIDAVEAHTIPAAP
jgi:hypothetical protein